MPKILDGMICTRCKNPEKEVIISLRYNGMNLCEKCFIEYFEHRIRSTIRKYSMINTGEKIGVEILANSNSAALLYFLKKFSDRRKISITGIIIDPGIKNCETEIKIAKTSNVKYYVYSFKDEFGYTIDDLIREKKIEKKDIYEKYNELKKDILDKKLLELKLDKFASGNNLDDEAGYALMNFLKGKIEKFEERYSIPQIKPLMLCPEKEVNLYAKINFPEINFENDNYENPNKKFKEIINLLSKNHPTISFQIVKSNEELKKMLE